MSISNIKNALFLTHPRLLKSEITGGVQLCSQEFYYIISNCEDLNLKPYNVQFTRNILQRLQMKLGLENYSMYNVSKDTHDLLQHIESNNISIVFLNMASTVRYSKPIKEKFGTKVKVIMLSHGNHSGDFLHLITKPLKKDNIFSKTFKKIRLGNLIATEALYRVKYLDSVITLSETEKQIENWFGGKKVAFLPRRLYEDFINNKPDSNRIGFVGRLDHPPNYQGISILLEAMNEVSSGDLKVRLVGAPIEEGKKLSQRFSCVEYLGELTDEQLVQEVKSWAFFLNPVWWYSTGASTKLAKAISWGIPIATTTAGMRGYFWKKGDLLVADSPSEMISLISDEIKLGKINYWRQQTRTVAVNGLTDEELKGIIKSTYK